MVIQDGDIEFGVLGPVECRTRGRAVALGHPRQRSVLAVLLVEANKAVPSGLLIDRLWGDDPPARARNVLSGYLTRLRGSLTAAGAPVGVTLTREAGGYLLTVEPTRVDLFVFRSLARQARTAAPEDRPGLLHRARGLWRGAPFAGTRGDWLAGVGRGIEEERLAVELACAEESVRRGAAADVVADLEALADRCPLDERVVETLMLALCRNGRQSDALRAFRAVGDRLGEELGVGPGPRLRQLHQRIVRGDAAVLSAAVLPADPADPADPAGASTTPRQLPPPPTHFTGRGTQLRRLDEQLRAAADDRVAAVPIAVVDGMAGVGKTALAVHWAHRHADRCPDGQLCLNLRGFDPHQPPLGAAEALSILLRALGVAAARVPTGVDEQAALYRSLLAGRRMLVLLDDAASSAQVRPLLPGTGGCLVLVTSRADLSGLVALDGGRRVPLGVLDRAEGVELLGRLVGEAAVRAETAAAAALVDACGRLPLAVRIAANLIGEGSAPAIADVVARLAAAPRRLDPFSTDDEHATVRAVFALSYRSLAPPVARAFRLLGTQGGGPVGPDAVAALLDVPPASARRLLDELCRAHLLEQVEAARYRLHDLLRLYAAERADVEEPADELRSARRRSVEWYLAALVAADRLLVPGRYRDPLGEVGEPDPAPAFRTYQQALGWCDTERRNLVSAVRQAAGLDEHATAWKIAWSLWGYFELRKPWTDWLSTHELGLRSARRIGDRRGEASILNSLGVAHYYPRRFDEARDCFERALEIWRQLGDDRGEAVVRNNLGNIALETRRLPEAAEHYRAALDGYRRAGSEHAEGVVHANLAEVDCLRGRFDAALAHATRAVAVQRRTGDRRAEALAGCQAGNALRGLGRDEEAAAALHRALSVSRGVGDQQTEAWALHYLAELRSASGDVAEARECWLESMGLFDALGDPQADDIRVRLAGPRPVPEPLNASSTIR